MRSSDHAAIHSARLWAIALTAFVLDLATKIWASHALTAGKPWPAASSPARLLLAFNPNLDLGLTLPGGGRLMYVLLGASAVVTTLLVAGQLSAGARSYVTALGMVLGGGLGNLVERALRGQVTDFLNLRRGSFNIADICISLGLLLYLHIRFRDGAREERWTWRTWAIPHVLPPRTRTRRRPV